MKSPIIWTDDLTVSTLFLEYATLSSELKQKAFNEHFDKKDMLPAFMIAADQEALIRTFASMLEQNNQALLTHLEKLGVLPKE